jgi:predicted transglutaminase-like cysteine proteinase
MLQKLIAFAIFAVIANFLLVTAGAEQDSRTLRLPVSRVAEPPLPYQDFCRSNPGHCDMTGAPVIELTPEVRQAINHVTSEVNAEFRYVPDWLNHGIEELWCYPSQGVGDCEDFALEKRRRLVEFGLPRAALTMAIVYHRKLMSPHAVLLVETTSGTYLLDNLLDDVVLWNEAPYNFEARERIDGKWDRFDQSAWVFELFDRRAPDKED